MIGIHRFGFLAGSPLAIPSPVAVADFKNGTYSINGVTMTLDDLFTTDTNWSEWADSDLVAGVGIRRVQGDPKAGPASTPALFSAVTKNFTAVMEYRLSCDPADVNSWALVDLEAVASPSFTDGVGITVRANKFNADFLPSGGANSTIEVWDYPGAVYSQDGEPPIGQLSRTAFTFNAGSLFQATNGGTAVGGTNAYLNPGTTLIGFGLEVGSTNCEAVVTRLTFYPPQNNTWLPILSS
jgi:hypothetical protein